MCAELAHLYSEKDSFTKSRRWMCLSYFLFTSSQMPVEIVITATTIEQFTFMQKLLSQSTLQTTHRNQSIKCDLRPWTEIRLTMHTRSITVLNIKV